MVRAVVCFAVLFASALPAAAQELKLEIADGRVTLEANGVPARQILAEWARIGGTRVVGAEKMSGPPLTLKLVGMPERQVLDIVLRNAAGFMAATREANGAPGASIYDRILILPTAAPVQASAGAPRTVGPGGAAMNGTQRTVRVPPRPPNLPSAPEPAEEPPVQEPDPADIGLPQPVFTFPAPQQGPAQNPVFVPMPNTGMPAQGGPQATPVITLTPNPNGQPTIYNIGPAQGAVAPPPSTPFGVVGAPTPGVVQQPPQQPGQPAPAGTRPPPR